MLSITVLVLFIGRMVALVRKGSDTTTRTGIETAGSGKDLGFWLWPLGAGRCKAAPYLNFDMIALVRRVYCTVMCLLVLRCHFRYAAQDPHKIDHFVHTQHVHTTHPEPLLGGR